jgi:RNA polymerase sigma-70 factor, ECF subfamily
MRELEGLSYKQIVDVTEVPIGTVMSRLARTRGHLQRSLKLEAPESGDMTVRTRAG